MPTSEEIASVMDVYPKLQYFEELSHGLTESLCNSLFADVQIEVEGEIFNCHRVILASMSHYFKTMFTSSMYINLIITRQKSKIYAEIISLWFLCYGMNFAA